MEISPAAHKLFMPLVAQGVEELHVEFSGSGDSGQIDDIRLVVSSGEAIDVPVDKKALRALFYKEYSTWFGDADFNNDGCYGSFVVRLRLGEFEREINWPETTYTSQADGGSFEPLMVDPTADPNVAFPDEEDVAFSDEEDG